MKLCKLFKKKENSSHCAVVVVAAGSSQRMGCDKLMAQLDGMPMLARTLSAFERSSCVDEIVVVTREERLAEVADLCKEYAFSKVTQVLIGGVTRAESALAGVSNVSSRAKLIAIHDGARPFVTQALIERVIRAAGTHMAAVPVLPSVDTLKALDENGCVCATVDRDRVLRVQTPQVFHADLIKGALTKAVTDKLPITDDCSAMERMGVKIMTVPGEEHNIKLTTPWDLKLAEMILREGGLDE